MSGLATKILSKAERLLVAGVFRVRHKVLGGTLQIDVNSSKKISWSRGIALRGLIAASDASIQVGSGCRIGKDSEVGCADKGLVILHEGVSLGPRTIVSTTKARIEIGSGTSFFSDCIVSGEVAIGAGCLFANNVTVLTGAHEIYGGGTIRENDAAAMLQPGYQPYRAVSIGADCWLGANSVVLPGVTLGRGCVVGANAVVTKSFPDYSILAGVPAKVIGSRRDGGNKTSPQISATTKRA